MSPPAASATANRLEELGRQREERQHELCRSGAMRLIGRLKQATLRLV
jgi:hypothetical protein